MTSFNVSNRALGIAAFALVAGGLLHIEYRVSVIADQVEAIGDVIFNSNETVSYTPAEHECLTRNIYYEARGEKIEGQYAVANVTLNRLKSGRWGNTICQVVYAKKQFSWTNQKHLRRPDSQGWAQASQVAVNALNGVRVRGLDRSMFYHATYVNPGWVDHDHYAGQVGLHKFYNRAKNSNVSI